MPSLSPYSCLSKHSFNKLTKAILIGLSSALLLSACGSDSPTGSTAPVEAEKPEKTYELTVRSAFNVKNAQVRIINAITGKELDKKDLVDGAEIKFDVKESNTNGSLLIAEISGKDNTSTYFDPTLNTFAPLNMPLHGAFIMLNTDGDAVIVSPFTEIVFQRALVRSNSFDSTKPDFSKLNLVSVVYANREVYSTFRVNPATLLPSIGSMDDLKKLLLDSSEIKKPLNTTTEYLNIFYGLGHINIQHREHNSDNDRDPTPALTFAKRAGQDMRDGSLDGMGLAGDGINGSVFLSKPMITPQTVNIDPKLNTKDGLEASQKLARENYANRLKPAVLDFLTNTLKSSDKVGIEYFTSVDYLTGMHEKYSENMPSVPAPRSLGAGNFKRAFGLGQMKLTKEPQKTLDGNCKETYTTVNPDAGKEGSTDQFVNVDCQIGANADGEVGAYNAIENLVGSYSTSDNSCQLTIYFNGNIILSKGNQRFNSSVNRDQSDAIIRLDPNVQVAPDKQRYLLNVASAERNPPEFIQIRTEGQNIISAVAGTMNVKTNGEATDLFPMRLDNEKLSCTGFKPVFNKPSS